MTIGKQRQESRDLQRKIWRVRNDREGRRQREKPRQRRLQLLLRLGITRILFTATDREPYRSTPMDIHSLCNRGWVDRWWPL